jgi:hypothetical protein
MAVIIVSTIITIPAATIFLLRKTLEKRRSSLTRGEVDVSVVFTSLIDVIDFYPFFIHNVSSGQ